MEFDRYELELASQSGSSVVNSCRTDWPKKSRKRGDGLASKTLQCHCKANTICVERWRRSLDKNHPSQDKIEQPTCRWLSDCHRQFSNISILTREDIQQGECAADPFLFRRGNWRRLRIIRETGLGRRVETNRTPYAPSPGEDGNWCPDVDDAHETWDEGSYVKRRHTVTEHTQALEEWSSEEEMSEGDSTAWIFQAYTRPPRSCYHKNQISICYVEGSNLPLPV